jgi:hypothetical protein
MRNPPRYIYQRTGGPIVTWNRIRPPGQTRAADTTALGSLGSTDVFNQPRRLPRGGAPEYIEDGFGGLGCMGPQPRGLPHGVIMQGMGCGSCGMGDDAPAAGCSCTGSAKTVTLTGAVSIGVLALTAVGALAVLKKLLA